MVHRERETEKIHLNYSLLLPKLMSCYKGVFFHLNVAEDKGERLIERHLQQTFCSGLDLFSCTGKKKMTKIQTQIFSPSAVNLLLNLLHWLFLIVILPDTGAVSCGLRRFFTSLYSLPSFLLLLGAASTVLSLQQTHGNHIYAFDLDYMQIFLYGSIVMTSAVGLKKFRKK